MIQDGEEAYDELSSIEHREEDTSPIKYQDQDEEIQEKRSMNHDDTNEGPSAKEDQGLYSSS